MGSFSIALTGLRAQSAALNTIGNNLANLNTTAFKKQTTTFADLFYQQTGTSGSGDALQQGLGTRVSSTQSSFGQGGLQTTGNSTDVAVQGNGFFVVSNGGVQELTRAGNFQISNSGALTTTEGKAVMGYLASNGVVGAASPLGGLSLPIGETQAAKATSQFSLTANLNSGAAVGTLYQTAVTVYDSLGTSHVAAASFTKTGTNAWSYSLSLPTGDATGTPVSNSGTLQFDSAGKLTAPSANVQGITFPGLTDGAADLNMQWSLYDVNGNATLSQTSGASSASATVQDGYASGSYQGFTVDTSGVVSAQFSNGQTTKVGQLAVASVTNLQGLQRTGDNGYLATAASGQATVGVAGLGGRGTIEDSTLEGSNVDIATEFSDLIVAQRAFEANSKTVTTFDTVTQETINLIR